MSIITPAVAANGFVTTHWSMVLSAGQNADSASRAALEILCERYWPALYGYVRRRGYSVEDAHDLTQEFFLRLLDRNLIALADQSKGRFRSFMLTVLKHFLADEWDKAKTKKRGGDFHLQSLSQMAEATYSVQTAATGMPELDFERDWAMTVLKNVLEGLEEEYTRGGKGPLFASLKMYLVGGGDGEPQAYSIAAADLGMSESTFKVAVCRIRQRYRERMRQEVAATVADARDVDTELRHLCRILAKTC